MIGFHVGVLSDTACSLIEVVPPAAKLVARGGVKVIESSETVATV
jgi:hypothetical protein